MADKPTDSAAVLPEIRGEPTPSDPSAEQRDQPSSTGSQFDQESVTRLADLLTERLVPTVTESVRAKLAPDIERGIQKTKDRRWKVFEDLDPEDIRIVADAVKRNDGDFQKTADDLAVRAILEERRQKPDDAGQPSASQARPDSTSDKGMSEQDLKEESRLLLEKFGLSDDGKEAVLKAWGGMEFDSVAQARVGLVDLALKAGRGESFSPADMVVPSGKGVSPQKSESAAEEADRLYSELNDLFLEPSTNRDRIASVKESLRKLGEEI
jgi:hypothetical protein